MQKNRRNAGAGENADPAERAPSGTRLLDDAGARKIFSHPDTYNRYEKGIREIPLDCLITLAKLYDCSLDYLAGVSDQPRNTEGDVNGNSSLSDDDRTGYF